MIIVRSSSFKKDYKNLSNRDKDAVDECLKLFLLNPFDLTLKNHSLSGKLKGSYSIKVKYDLRVIYRKEKGFIVVVLVAVGKHNDVY